MKNYDWSLEEDSTIIAELNTGNYQTLASLAQRLIKNPLFKNRTYDGLRVHIGYIRNGGKVSTLPKSW